MDIEYRICGVCDRPDCGEYNIEATHFSEIHGHRYHCIECGYTWWGGRLKNKDKNIKRPICPTASDMDISYCQICMLEGRDLGYSETLEVHHIDDNPQNNDRLNLMVACTACHKLIHYQRTYRYNHYVRRHNEVNNG